MFQIVPFHVKAKKIAGTSYGEVYGQAMERYKAIERKTKRRPYVRSKYFGRQKVFLTYFWGHMRQKNPRERYRRLKYFSAAIELIERSPQKPTVQDNPHKAKERLYRFVGMTREQELFFVQIKEDKRNGSKYFMSCFPFV